MSLASRGSITSAWFALMAITVASVGTAELVGDRLLAVAIVMAITATKGAVILWRFMDLRSAPPGVRYYLAGWTVACAVMIAALFAAAGQ